MVDISLGGVGDKPPVKITGGPRESPFPIDGGHDSANCSAFRKAGWPRYFAIP